MGGAPLRRGNYLYPLESLLLACTRPSEEPQVFILGLPRSGTTLVYQYIAHRLRVAYFTNGVGSHPMAPCVVTYWQNRVNRPYESDFESRYGKVRGPLAPREAGAFWNRHFDPERYQTFEEIPPRKIDAVRRTVWRIQRLYGDVPFVNKNVKHLLRIDALKRIFPRSLFLVVERDTKDVALSLLRARHAGSDDPRRWLSARPPDYDALRELPAASQVAGQCRALAAKLEADLEGLPEERVLRVPYERFCERPEWLVEEWRSRVGPVSLKSSAVASFRVSKNVPETAEERALMEEMEKGASCHAGCG
jgi:hypothetical protein